MENKNIFAKRIKELRLSKGLSQAAVGALIGIKAQGINDMEHGRTKTRLDKAIILADFYNVSIDYLVGRTDNPKVNR